ncbi:MAG: glycosyltransferase [Actinomycetota bacterium]|nr:glycosyltransferase [Actinomycetota bacterium]
MIRANVEVEVMNRAIAIAMIVKDEEANLQLSLPRVASWADQIVVVDTGSKDASADIAQSLGAEVYSYRWSNDFSDARNFANEQVKCDFILSIDADQLVEGDVPRLIVSLKGSKDVASFRIQTDIVRPERFGGSYRVNSVKLFRRGALRWFNPVNERLLTEDGIEPVARFIDPSLLSIRDIGGRDEEKYLSASRRNLSIALEDFREHLDLFTDRNAIASRALEIGMTFVSIGEHEESCDYFDQARGMASDPVIWLRATDMLSRQYLQLGNPRHAMSLAISLRERGANDNYCKLLCARALAKLGDDHAAYEFVRDIRSATDPFGQSYPSAFIEDYRRYLSGKVDSVSSSHTLTR